MKINTTRFGELDYDAGRVITFKQGILGFPDAKRYILLDHDTLSTFKWLQSLENEELAFVVIDPVTILEDYRIEIQESDIADLKLANLEKAVVLCIVNIAKQCTSVTVNLLGPLVINTEKMIAKQVILINSSLNIKHEIVRYDETGKTMPEK